MLKNKVFLFYFVCLLGMSSFLSCSTKKLPTTDIVIQKENGETLTVNAEIAKTQEQRARGFMERKNIPSGTGMLFIFESDQILSFWMKDTPSPLSIAYIDSRGTIRDIFDMKPYSLDAIVSTSSVRYALEVPQGWFSKNGIKAGDKVILDF